ncbi:MAG TPA: UvrB/UvrC motif-containing protein [Chthoniobacterales bacterium]
MSNLDLNNLLDGWPHEPGSVKARKIVGADGREKIQLRIDLGLIQMEVNGRPDGLRPFGHESLLEYHRTRAREAAQRGETYECDEADLLALQQEGVQYYHRYLSLFQLRDFAGVARDTYRNLQLFDFVSQHCEEEDAKWVFEQYRPYVLMMNTRARASLEIQSEHSGKAIEIIEAGKKQIEDFYRAIGQAQWIDSSTELGFLNEWLTEVRENLPLSPIESMERDLQKAIADEAYERAAELRDAIRNLSRQPSNESLDHGT